MKWFLPGKAMLNKHINLKSIKDILSEQQTNQNQMRMTNMMKPSLRSNHAMRPLNIRMHCNVLWRASQRCLNKYGKPFRTWSITFFNK
jgi:hypothetical protein